jgi:hypothetical protein
LQHGETPPVGDVEARQHDLTTVSVTGQHGGHAQRSSLSESSWIVREQESRTSRAS